MNHLYKFTPVVKYIPTRYTYRPTIFGRPFVKRFALCYRTLVCPVLSVLSVCDVGVFWPNGWTDQDETWKAGRPWPRPHCVKWDPAPPPPPKKKRASTAPYFGPRLLCQTAGCIWIPLGTSRRHCPHLFGPCLLWPRSPVTDIFLNQLVQFHSNNVTNLHCR